MQPIHEKNRKYNWFTFTIALVFLLLYSCAQKTNVSRDINTSTMTQENYQIPSDAIQCISGLTYVVLKEGNGKEYPGPEDIVRAIISSNYNNIADTQSLKLSEIGRGLSEAFQVMTPNQKIRAWIPAYLQKDPIKDNDSSVAVYDLELIDFTRTKEPRSIPDHLISPRLDE